MSNSDQEIEYYVVKNAVEEIFGINPTTEQMNQFFFEVVNPYLDRCRRLTQERQRLHNTLRILVEFAEGD